MHDQRCQPSLLPLTFRTEFGENRIAVIGMVAVVVIAIAGCRAADHAAESV